MGKYINSDCIAVVGVITSIALGIATIILSLRNDNKLTCEVQSVINTYTSNKIICDFTRKEKKNQNCRRLCKQVEGFDFSNGLWVGEDDLSTLTYNNMVEFRNLNCSSYKEVFCLYPSTPQGSCTFDSSANKVDRGWLLIPIIGVLMLSE